MLISLHRVILGEPIRCDLPLLDKGTLHLHPACPSRLGLGCNLQALDPSSAIRQNPCHQPKFTPIELAEMFGKTFEKDKPSASKRDEGKCGRQEEGNMEYFVNRGETRRERIQHEHCTCFNSAPFSFSLYFDCICDNIGGSQIAACHCFRRLAADANFKQLSTLSSSPTLSLRPLTPCKSHTIEAMTRVSASA